MLNGDHFWKFVNDNGAAIITASSGVATLLINQWASDRKAEKEWERARRDRDEMKSQLETAKIDRAQIAADLTGHTEVVKQQLASIEQKSDRIEKKSDAAYEAANHFTERLEIVKKELSNV